MTQRIAYVEAVFGADITAFRRGTSQVRQELGVLSDQVSGLSNVGRRMTLMLTAPLVAAGTAAVKLAADFDEAMTNVRSILTDMSQDEFARLTDETLKWGASIRSGPQAAAEALYTVVSAGFTNIDDAMMVAREATAMAEAGLADLTGSAEALSSAVLTYGIDTEEGIGHMSDVITRAVQVGVGSMDEFATASSTLAATAYSLGVSYDEAMGTVAYFTQRGKDARTAATELNMAMTAMYKPTEAMSTAMHQLGANSAVELIDKFGGVQGAIIALGSTVDNSQEGLAAMFGRVQAMRAVNLLTSDIEGANAALAEFYGDVEGATDAAREIQLTSLAAQFDMLGSAVHGAAVALGDDLGKILQPVISGLRDLFLGVLNLPPEFLSLAVAFGAAVAAAGPLLWLLGNIASPLSLLAGLVATLGVAFVTNFGGIRDTVTTAVEGITGGLGPLKDAMEEFFGILLGPAPEPNQMFSANDMIGDTQATWDFSVGEGDTGWSIWQSRGEEWADITWEAFSASFNEAVNGEMYQVGDDFSLALGDSITPSEPLINMSDLVNLEEAQNAEDYSVGGRISRAISEAWPKVETAFGGILTNISTWFTNDFLPSFDTWGGDILSRLAESISASNVDDRGEGSPVYTAVRSLLGGGIQDGINSIGGIIQENTPGIGKGLGELVSAIGSWLETTGIPTLSRTVGYVFGTLASVVTHGIGTIFQTVFNAGRGIAKGDAGEAASFWGEAIAGPFSEGFEQAKNDQGISGGIEGLFADLAGLFLTIGVPVFALNLLGGSFGSSIAGAVLRAIGTAVPLVFTTGLPAIFKGILGVTSVWSTLTSVLETGILKALYAWDAVAAIGPALTGIFSSIIAGIPIAALIAAALAAGGIIVAGLVDASKSAGDQYTRDLAISQPTFAGPRTAQATGMGNDPLGLLPSTGAYRENPTSPDQYSAMGMDNLSAFYGGTGGYEAAKQFNTEFRRYSEENPEETPATALFQEMERQFSDGAAYDPINNWSEAAKPIMSVPFIEAQNELMTFSTNLETSTTGGISLLTEWAGAADSLLDGLIEDMRILGGPAAFAGAIALGLGLVGGIEGRAGGGSAMANQTYLIGENGPELLNMGNRSGQIIPNESFSSGGNSSSVNYNEVSIAAQMDVDYLLDEFERRGIHLTR